MTGTASVRTSTCEWVKECNCVIVHVSAKLNILCKWGHITSMSMMVIAKRGWLSKCVSCTHPHVSILRLFAAQSVENAILRKKWWECASEWVHPPPYVNERSVTRSVPPTMCILVYACDHDRFSNPVCMKRYIWSFCTNEVTSPQWAW